MKNFYRFLSVTPIVQQQRSLVKLKRLQAHFQADDGRLIWQKGGLPDRILYGLTVTLCFVGLGGVLAYLYDEAKPPSWKTKD